MQELALLVLLSGGAVFGWMRLAARRERREAEALRASEARFRGLTELSADWFWETDAEHRLTWLSGGGPVATFFGSTPTFGRRFWEIPRVEVDPRALQDLLERLGQGLAFFDLEIARADGRGARQIHILSGQSRHGPGGEFLGYRGVGRDVTEQRRAERALAEAKDRLELAHAGGRLAEWHYELASHEITLGRGVGAILGDVSLASLTDGAVFGDKVHPQDREAVLASFVHALKGEADYEADFRLQDTHGEWKWVRATGRVTHRDAEGRALRLSGVAADIDRSKRAEETLREAEERYRSLVELSPDGVFVHSGGMIEYVNPAGARLLGARSPRRLLGMKLGELVHPEDQARFAERMQYLAVGPGATPMEERRLLRLDGTEVVVEASGVSFLERGRMVVQSVFRDATEARQAREALAEREKRFRDVAEASAHFVWETDAEWRFTFLTDRVEAVLGDAPAALLGRRPQDFLALGEERRLEEWFQAHGAPGRAFRDVAARWVTRSGAAVWLALSAVPVRGPDGAFRGYRGTAADITARKAAEARIEQLAHRDGLTGLPNRALLADRAGQAILGAARARGQLALLYLDLDRFKLVNESYGHAAGDALLRALAERLQNSLGEATLARLGGDEFAVLQPVRTAEDAALLAQRLLAMLARPFTVEGRPLTAAASVGIAVYPNDGRDFAELLQNADAAMSHAKESGRGVFRFFSPALHERAAERLRLENDLRGALARGELVMHWQPAWRGRGAIAGAEALVRWRHPERGLLLPDEFVPLAEDAGMIRAVGEWTFEHALAQAGAWQRRHPGGLWYAVNVSAPELAEGEAFYERVREALAAHRLEGRQLELEITERVLMSSLADNLETLRRVGSLGVRFAIDDFGTGYSSLAYLRQLPINKLKIDRSFLRELATHPSDEAIVRAIVALARTLGMSVSAEGVETPAQLERVLKLGCDEWQGHLHGMPVDAAGFEALLAARDAARA